MPRKPTNAKQSAVKIQKAPVLQKVPSQATGPAETEDHEYALVSVLYHALQGVQASEQYIDDAERAGDDELAKFFVECRDEQATRANRAKALLSSRMDSEDHDEDEDDEDSEDDDDEDSEGDESPSE